MHATSICRLCASICRDYKQLYDDLEVYEITIKYFDPMFLNMKHHTALCFECWCHIVDFHNFQQTVQLAQSKFYEYNDTDDPKNPKTPKPPGEDCLPNPPMEIRNAKLQSLTGICNNVSLAEGPDGILNGSIAIKQEVGDVDDELDDDELDDDMLVPELLLHVNETETVNMNSYNDPDDEYTNHDTNYYTSAHHQTKCITAKKAGKHLKSYSTAKELDRRIAIWKPTLECRICTKSLSTFTLLRNHFGADHPKAEFYILCCKRKFFLRSRFEEHLHLHGDNPFKCEPCGKHFRWRITLTRHLRKCPQYHTTKPKAYTTSSERGDIAATNSDLLWFMPSTDTTRKFKCNHCEKSYTSGNSLREHMSVHTGKNLYSCQLCPKTFKYRSAWRVHQMKEHNNIRRVQKSQKVKVTAKAVVDKVKQNGADDAGTAPDLHASSHEVARKFKCTHCEKSYTSGNSLREHMSIHTGQDLYSCQHCPRTFKYRSAWRVHQIKEHPTTRKFPQYQNVKITVKRDEEVKDPDHAEETLQLRKNITCHLLRKFQCSLCEKSYVHAKSLRQHMSTHTGKDVHQCPTCSKTFKYRAALRLHQKKLHANRQIQSKRK